jgi:hypothetical protein
MCFPNSKRRNNMFSHASTTFFEINPINVRGCLAILFRIQKISASNRASRIPLFGLKFSCVLQKMINISVISKQVRTNSFRVILNTSFYRISINNTKAKECTYSEKFSFQIIPLVMLRLSTILLWGLSHSIILLYPNSTHLDALAHDTL